uniref:Seroin transcript 2B n=1 Tax=Antheraea yamamai TaxID=7121 RepID=A0A4P2U9E8_ANTYA|nr:seroin transcript 2B [Antheraea yamamai]
MGTHCFSVQYVAPTSPSGVPDQSGVGAFSYQDSAGNRAFNANFENQRLAFNAAQKAFDLTSNQAGYNPNFNYPGAGNFPNFGDFPGVPLAFPAMPNFGNEFGAFAAAVANPGYRQQIAAINPSNPGVPNVNEVRYSNSETPGNNGGYMAVSSTSYSTSSQNADGQITNSRAAETVINDNGKITKYSVKN